MKKFSLKTWIEKIQLVTLRFPFTLLFIVGLTVFLLIQINHQGNDHQERCWSLFSLGILLSLCVTLFSEGFKNIYKIGLNLLAIILLATYCYFLPDKFLPIHFYKVISIGIVLFFSAFFVSYFKKDADIPFWEFSKEAVIQFIISAVFAQILMAGLSLAVLSLKELFKIHIDIKIYSDIAVVCYVLFGGIYFLANIPDKTEKNKQTYNFNKFLKILGLYILLPILVIYSLILYVYLIQIILKWELPNGYVSTLISVLGIGGFLTMLILYPLRLEKNKVTNLLSKYFPVLLLPLLILMSIGIFRRLGDYGMTINRLYVLILNVWFYGISIYLLISKANHLKWIVISFASVLLIASIGPWSVYNITERTMIKEIGQLLSEANLLKDGKVIENHGKSIALNPKLSETLSEDIKYISTTFGVNKLQQYFGNSIQDQNWTEINKSLGINNLPIQDTNFSARIKREESSLTDIDSYHSFVTLPIFNSADGLILKNKQVDITIENNKIIIKSKVEKDSVFEIQLKSKVKEIIQAYKNQNALSSEKMTITTNHCMLIINSIHGNYYSQKDSVYISNCDALLFLK